MSSSGPLPQTDEDSVVNVPLIVGPAPALAKERYVSPVHLSYVYFGLGDLDKMFVLLDKAFQDRDFSLAFFFALPIFDELRSDPRFQDLLRRSFSASGMSGVSN
jgi:hypothetical protein